jgi:hypothetical protein
MITKLSCCEDASIGCQLSAKAAFAMNAQRTHRRDHKRHDEACAAAAHKCGAVFEKQSLGLLQ